MSLHSYKEFCVCLSMLRIVGGKCATCLFCFLYSRDCLASRDMTVAFCVWLSEMIAVGCFELISSLKGGCGTYCVCITST